jgi:hypothetical protein
MMAVKAVDVTTVGYGYAQGNNGSLEIVSLKIVHSRSTI